MAIRRPPPAWASFGGGQAGALIKQMEQKKREAEAKKAAAAKAAADRAAAAKATAQAQAAATAKFNSPEAETDRIVAEMLAELGYARDSARREAERSAQDEIRRSQALAQALQQIGMPQLIQGVYQNSGQSLAGMAEGFSQDVQGLASQQAAEQGNILAGTGQEGAIRNEGQNMGDVLYGQHGFIPARGLEQTGAAFASEAALQPGFALQFGNMAASGVMKDFQDEILGKFADDEAMIRSKRPSILAEAQERERALKDKTKAEALQLYEAGLITKRELAKRMGVPGWKRFPDQLLGAAEERPKADASLSKAAGYLIDEYGAPILNSKGKMIPLPKDPEKPWGNSTVGYWESDGQGGWIQVIAPAPKENPTRTAGGYIWEKDPKTGKWLRVGGSGPTPANYQMKTTKDGATVVFDPMTGDWTEVKPPPRPKAKLTTQQRATARAAATAFAEAAHDGFVDEDGVEYPPLTLAEALEEIKKEPIPWSVARQILLNYYRKRGVDPRYNPNAKGPPAPKGNPARGGGSAYDRTSNRIKTNYSNDSAGLAGLWIAAGGDPSVANVAAAIALAESGGRVNAWNPNGRDKSAGLWQINYHGSLRAPRTRQFGTPEQLRRDPLANARAAVAIYKSAGNSFTPWTTYTSGKYKRHLNQIPNQGDSQNVSYTGGGKVGSVVNFAHQQLGKPYVFGSGPSLESFDCSDLIQAAYKQIGINIPRVTYDQIKVGTPVKWGQFKPGDLIFTNKGGHVMLYIGNGKMISAPRKGDVVKIVDVSGYKDSFVTARRILNEDPFAGGSAYL